MTASLERKEEGQHGTMKAGTTIEVSGDDASSQ
jgi:hypothetical protein